MFDSKFDPYERLELLEGNIQQIARGYNAHTETINQLLHQNRQLNELLKIARLEVQSLQLDVETLKARPPREIINNTNYGNH